MTKASADSSYRLTKKKTWRLPVVLRELINLIRL